MSDLSNQIEALVAAEVDKRTAQYRKTIQEAISILQTLVSEPEITCDDDGRKADESTVKDTVDKAPASGGNATCEDCGERFEAKTAAAKYCKTCRYKRVSAARGHANAAQRAWNGSLSLEPPRATEQAASTAAEPSKPVAYTVGVHNSHGTFDDPYDCLVCRNAGDLCMRHENMAKQGIKPTKYKPYSEGVR